MPEGSGDRPVSSLGMDGVVGGVRTDINGINPLFALYQKLCGNYPYLIQEYTEIFRLSLEN